MFIRLIAVVSFLVSTTSGCEFFHKPGNEETESQTVNPPTSPQTQQQTTIALTTYTRDAASFEYDSISVLELEFAGDVGAGITDADLVVVNVITDAAIDSEALILEYDAAYHILRLDLSALALLPGRYEIRFSHEDFIFTGDKTDSDGAIVIAELVAMIGDADLDGDVDDDDLAILSTNYDGTGGWTEGDFNGDGQISMIDLDMFGQHEYQVYGNNGEDYAGPALTATLQSIAKSGNVDSLTFEFDTDLSSNMTKDCLSISDPGDLSAATVSFDPETNQAVVDLTTVTLGAGMYLFTVACDDIALHPGEVTDMTMAGTTNANGWTAFLFLLTVE